MQGGEPEQPILNAEGNVQFTYTPSTPTNENVKVGISTKTGYNIKYSIGDAEGEYQDYTGEITVEENTAIYVKLANSSGVTGGVATGNVQNIDKVAPNAFTPTIGEITENSIEVNASTIDTGSIGCAPINTGIKEYKYYANGELKYTGLDENVTIGGLTAGTEYSIYVIAEDKAGNPTTSSVVTATTSKAGITSTEIANNPEYIGAYVDYTPQNGAEVGWRIFYADSENIYLIADDYILGEYVPEPTNGTTIDKTGNYSEYYIDLKTLAESSTAYTVEDERVEKWLSGLNTFTATNKNMKATAYLLDTDAWSVFKDTKNEEESKVEYVIGGPTLELFIASYNNTHETDINYEVTNKRGYSIKWSTDSSYSYYIEGLDTTETLYINDATDDRAWGYWLASPSAYDSRSIRLFYVCSLGTVGSYGYTANNVASRPLVCLKSGIQLVEQESGKYAIQ